MHDGELRPNMLFTVLVALLTAVHVELLEIPEYSGGRVECLRSKIDHNVTLASGHHAGNFLKANNSIKRMSTCVKQCCQMNGCDVALFSNGACYSVKCKSIELCAPKKNTDKRMSISISYVAKTRHKIQQELNAGKSGEPALEDNLIAEVTQESPFSPDESINFAQQTHDSGEKELLQNRKEKWRETKDMFVAISCGFLAVTVGVVGVISMTRKLVEDDDEIYINDNGEIFRMNTSVEEIIDVSKETNKHIQGAS